MQALGSNRVPKNFLRPIAPAVELLRTGRRTGLQHCTLWMPLVRLRWLKTSVECLREYYPSLYLGVRDSLLQSRFYEPFRSRNYLLCFLIP